MKDIVELTIKELVELLNRGEITSVDLVKEYMKRIQRYDKSGPKLNSILELNPDAIHIAELLDLERKEKGPRGILHGVPILIKDNINTGDKMHTSAGSLALADLYAPNDAFIVKKLREQGAIILGKTNMSEFAHFMSFNSPEGYSSRGGQVINPYDKDISPSGSSSGSAVAVSANLAMAAIGTETNGSIISPSRNNLVVGIKPTVGLVSRNGIIPISSSQDTSGPIARTVEDAAALLDAIVGYDEMDNATCETKNIKNRSYYECTKDNISGKRIGICTNRNRELNITDQMILQDAVNLLKNYGAEIVNVQLDSKPDDYLTVSIYEFKYGINKYLSSVKGHTKMNTLKDIIEFNKNNSDTCLKYGQEILEMAEKTSGTLTEDKYIATRKGNLHKTRYLGLDKTLNEWNLDAIITTEILSLPAVAGYPCITVPSGIKSKSPKSIIFIGRPFSEDILLSLAYTYEKSSKLRKAPF